MAKTKARKPFCIVSRGNVKVPIYRREQRKNDALYISYAVADCSDGTRKLYTFSDLGQAKTKAGAIADAIVAGDPATVRIDDLRLEIRRALEALEPTGLGLLPAAQLIVGATKILGGHAELLAACAHWVQNRPDGPFTPKKVSEAGTEFVGRRTKVGERRRRTLASYYRTFAEKFGNRCLHEVTALELKDFVDGQSWKPKTHNEFLKDVALLYKDAAFRGQVPAGCNPAKSVERRAVCRATIGVFEPWEARQILNKIDDELVPFMAIWLFAGIRKEEISKLSWQQVLRGLETGSIYMEAEQTKTGQPRSVPLEANLKVWLQTWLLRNPRTSGPVLPTKWAGVKRIDQLTPHISKKCGIVWKDNAPRHSFGTYFFRICKDAGQVVRAMGTSLQKFEKHYWNRCETVTEAVAKEWFGIMPPEAANVVPMKSAAEG